MKDNGRIIKKMEEEYTHLITEMSTKENTGREESMVKVS